MTSYTILPWVRQGLPAARLPEDAPGPGLAARVTLPVELRVNDDVVTMQVRLYGPGDVVGIDRRQVVRAEPPNGARAFEPNYLAAIEFDRPDFPWLFTPAAADGRGRLRPWLCLVVVRRQEGVRLTADRARPLPVLEIAAPARPAAELPDLADAWAWAHAQVAGGLAPGESLEAVIAQRPERTVSRLICPRRLEPGASYLACVVPAFDVGRKTGLGLPLTQDDEAQLLPAWRADDPALTGVQLPVYYSWEFSTGASGDFESLVALLKARRLSAQVGVRELDVSAADPGLPRIPPASPDATLGLEGALMAPETRPKGFGEAAGKGFREALRLRLSPPAGGDPLVTPPSYGLLHAAQPAVPAEGAGPHWLRELNLDPRYRAVAAFGAAVVQDQQEALMASAWEQVGEVERANQILRQAQLVRAVGQSVHHNRLARLDLGSLLQITRAAHGRLREAEGATLRLTIAESSTPSTVVTAAFRRVARPRGPLARRALPVAERRVRPFVARLAGGVLRLRIARPPTGAITLDAAEARFLGAGGARPAGIAVSAAGMAALAIAQIPQRPAFRLTPPELPGVSPPPPIMILPGNIDSAAAQRFRAAAIAHQVLIQPPPARAQAASRALQVDGLKETLLARLDPAVTVVGRVGRLVTYPGPRDARDPLEPIMAAPSFPQPMYAALRDLSQELLLPGLGEVEDNSVALLRTNPRFVEAYMVGLNHEFARELLWRGYPTDQRGSYFRQFWDVRGQAGGPDIPPIHGWPAASALGQSAAGGQAGQLVLLIRGELLRRYPTAVIYAARAARAGSQLQLRKGAEERHPLFGGALDPDLRFVGFDLTEAEARGGAGDPGWFFVIQQQPTEPRFGLDIGDPAGDATQLSPGADAAATALTLLQRPVRIAIHAQELLG